MEILNLNSPTRKKVNFEDVEYELKDKSEFTIEEQISFSSYGKEITDLFKDGKYTKQKIQKMIKIMDVIINKILIAPKHVLKKLSNNHKTEILNFFLSRKANIEEDMT